MRPGRPFELQHWTGHWTTTSIPVSVGKVDQLASDGHSGFRLLARDRTHGSDFVHDNGGRWDHVAIPIKGKLTSSVGALSPVRGSRSMWAIGFLVDEGSIPRYGDVLRLAL